MSRRLFFVVLAVISFIGVFFAGYDKSGAVSFFDKLEELEKEYGIDQRDAVNDFISSHPTAKERRERILKID